MKDTTISQRITSEQFRNMRSTARKRAMQYLFSKDIAENWSEPLNGLPLFQGMTTDLDEDQEVLQGPELDAEHDYVLRLVEGVTQNREKIDALIRQAASNWRLERMSTVDRCILRVAICEMMLFDQITPAIAINEAINMAKKFGQAEAPKFINGVLDKVKALLAAETKTEETADK